MVDGKTNSGTSLEVLHAAGMLVSGFTCDLLFASIELCIYARGETILMFVQYFEVGACISLSFG